MPVADDEVFRTHRGFEDFFVLESFMVLIKVQWDAYNRQFKLLDREISHTLEDGETYMLIADVSVRDLELKQEMEIHSGLVDVTI